MFKCLSGPSSLVIQPSKKAPPTTAHGAQAGSRASHEEPPTSGAGGAPGNCASTAARRVRKTPSSVLLATRLALARASGGTMAPVASASSRERAHST